MAGFLEPRQRADFLDAPLHVAVAGFPVIGGDAVLLQFRVGGEEAGGFHVGHEGGVRVDLRQVAGHDDADLVGEDLFALVIDHAAAVAVAVEAERQIGAGGAHGVGHVVQHFHRFGVGVVVGEGVVELGVERHDFDAEAFEKLGRDGRGGAVAGGADDLELAGHAEIADQVVEIGLAHAVDELVAAAVAFLAFAVQHDIAQLAHFIRSVGEGPVEAHFHAGPAVGVVAGRDHGDRRHVEVELREIGHGREGRADIFHLDAGLHEADDQGVLDRQRIVAIVVADGDHGGDAALVHLGAEAEAEGRHARQVDLVRVFPARIVFAKAGGLDHRIAQERPRIGGDVGQRFGHGWRSF